jgi:hypothetical protein
MGGIKLSSAVACVVACAVWSEGALAQPSADPPLTRPAAHGEARPWAAGVSEREQALALELYLAGNQEFAESRFTLAIAKYREALWYWDHPAIRFNMAVSLINLDQSIEAQENLESSLRYGAAPLGVSLYNQGLTYRKLLDAQLVRLRIACPEPDAKVTLDGKVLFTGPGSTEQIVLPGEHQVVATKVGFVTVSETLVLVAGKTSAYEISPAIEPPTRTTVPCSSDASRAAPYILRARSVLPWVASTAPALLSVAAKSGQTQAVSQSLSMAPQSSTLSPTNHTPSSVATLPATTSRSPMTPTSTAPSSISYSISGSSWNVFPSTSTVSTPWTASTTALVQWASATPAVPSEGASPYQGAWNYQLSSAQLFSTQSTKGDQAVLSSMDRSSPLILYNSPSSLLRVSAGYQPSSAFTSWSAVPNYYQLSPIFYPSNPTYYRPNLTYYPSGTTYYSLAPTYYPSHTTYASSTPAYPTYQPPTPTYPTYQPPTPTYPPPTPTYRSSTQAYQGPTPMYRASTPTYRPPSPLRVSTPTYQPLSFLRVSTPTDQPPASTHRASTPMYRQPIRIFLKVARTALRLLQVLH